MHLLLQRYVAAQFILPLVVSTLFFVTFLLTFELFKLMELLVTRDVEVIFIATLLWEMGLSFLPLALPLSIFFSMIYCTGKICADSEYIAMRAAGMKNETLMIPFVMLGLSLVVSVYFLNHRILPRTQEDLKKKVNYLASSGLLAGIKPGQFFTMIPGVTLFATSATEYGRDLEEVFLYLDNEKNKKIVFAQTGSLIVERETSKLIEKINLKLNDGNILTLKDNNMEKILFKEYSFPVTQKQFDDKVSLKETMLTSDELKEVFTMTEDQAWAKYRFNKKDIFNAQYEYWSRKNTAFVCLIWCILGFVISVRGNRSKGKSPALIGLLMIIIYYGIFFSLVSLARKATIPVPVAVFFPSIVLVFIGSFYYRKLNWQS